MVLRDVGGRERKNSSCKTGAHKTRLHSLVHTSRPRAIMVSTQNIKTRWIDSDAELNSFLAEQNSKGKIPS